MKSLRIAGISSDRFNRRAEHTVALQNAVEPLEGYLRTPRYSGATEHTVLEFYETGAIVKMG